MIKHAKLFVAACLLPRNVNGMANQPQRNLIPRHQYQCQYQYQYRYRKNDEWFFFLFFLFTSIHDIITDMHIAAPCQCIAAKKSQYQKQLLNEIDPDVAAVMVMMIKMKR
jgi:hypothetical protein